MSEEIQVGKSKVRVMRDDITLLDIDAFVYYAQPDLLLGTGFGGAIAVRGGPSIQQELETLAPAEPLQTVVSSAGKLKATFILHAVGPRFQEEDVEDKLRTTVVNVLKKADEHGIQRVALPAMGRGFYAVPLDLGAKVAVAEVKQYLAGETGIQEVVFCVNDHLDAAAYQAQL